MKRPARGTSKDSLFETQSDLPLESAPTTAEDESGEPASPGSGIPTLGQRLAGAGLDIAAHLAVLGLVIAGSWWLGVPPSRLSLLPLALFTAGFSFVYHVLPLVFWGHTPGMARFGLAARSLDGGPLAMGQAVRRWLGALLSVATLGLFLAFDKERTLADRLSGSTVHKLST